MLRKNIWRRMRYRRENKQLVLQHHRRGRNTSVETSDLASNQTELHAAASLQQRKLRSSSSMITNSTGPTGGTIKIIEMDAAVGASLDVGDDGTIHDTAHLDGVMPTVVGTIAESTDNNNNNNNSNNNINSTDGTSDDTTTASAAAAAVAAVAASLADEAAVEAAVAAAESHFHLQQQQQQLDDEVVDIVISESDVMSAAAANVTTALDEAAIAAAVAVAAAVVASTSTTAATSLDHIMAPDEESTSNAVTNTKNIELIDNEVDMDDQRVAV